MSVVIVENEQPETPETETPAQTEIPSAEIQEIAETVAEEIVEQMTEYQEISLMQQILTNQQSLIAEMAEVKTLLIADAIDEMDEQTELEAILVEVETPTPEQPSDVDEDDLENPTAENRSWLKTMFLGTSRK